MSICQNDFIKVSELSLSFLLIMSTNIKIMRFLSIIAILSLILSYVIHLNMELGFCVLNTPWISNNFLFTILSGAFASVVIALLMEARQYTLNKEKARNQIFCEAINLMSQFYIIKDIFSKVKEQQGSIITPEAVISSASECERSIDTLHNIDYHPIRKSDKLLGNLEDMFRLIENQIAPTLFNSKFIQQAVLKDRILELEHTGKSTSPTYNSYYSKQIIDKLLEDIIPIFNDLTVCVQKIAKTENRQERFDNMFKKLKRFEDSQDVPSLEKFLGL